MGLKINGNTKKMKAMENKCRFFIYKIAKLYLSLDKIQKWLFFFFAADALVSAAARTQVARWLLGQ